MKIQRMFKFALPALLLAAGISAYAAEPEGKVTLGNGNTVTWAEFVNVIKDPSNLKATLPEDNQAAINKANAEKEVEDAKTKVAEAKTKVETKKTDLETAKQKVKVAQDSVDAKNARYKQWEDSLSTWRLLRENKQADRNDIDSRLTELYRGSTTPIKWLRIALPKATNIVSEWDSYYWGGEWPENYSSEDKIYYKLKGKVLIVSFDESLEGNSNWVPADAKTFQTKIVDNTDVKVAVLYIDCGKTGEEYNYKEGSGTYIGCLKVSWSSTSDKDYILESVYSALKALSTQSNYTENINQEEINNLETKKATINTELDNINQKIADYTLNNEDGKDKPKQKRLQDEYDDAVLAQKNADREVSNLNDELTTANTELSTANTELSAAEGKLTEATQIYNEEVAKLQDTAITPYKNITLTGDVIANEMISSYDGDIDGNGHVITLGSEVSSLFRTFSGHLTNVAVNGRIATSTSNAGFTTVANWLTTSGQYYNEFGTSTTYNNIGKLGFDTRETFGVDFTTKKLATLTNDSKVYNITVYTPETQTQHYVLLKDGQLVNDIYPEGLTLAPNTFVKSETFDLTDIPNVFYTDNTSKNVVITDGAAFYCPVDIKAAQVTYDRQFAQRVNAVCLPFELEYNDNIEAICRYDKETTEKFWFKRIAGSIPANTPVIIYKKEGLNNFKLGNDGILSDITIKKTENQIIIDEGDADDPSKSYGLLKPASPEEFAEGATGAYKIFGLAGGEFLSAPEGSKENFPALRTVIYSKIARNTTQAPRRIGILDENGVDITDSLSGVESITTEASSLSVIGGQGEITITSEADYGKVAIYSINGSLASTANVMVGTTTVNLQQGIYIVMGKKVVVK